MKRCSKCKEYLNGYRGRGNVCKTCYNAYQIEYRKANPPDKESGRARAREVFYKKYGITEEDYQHLYNLQNGACLICGNRQNERRLAVDHDHKTNRVRGLLCNQCNIGLGAFNDNIILIEKAISYLGGDAEQYYTVNQ